MSSGDLETLPDGDVMYPSPDDPSAEGTGAVDECGNARGSD